MTSHRLPGWGERPEYPREAQERDYRERGEQAKVLAIAADYKPALIFNTAPGAIDGTPVISPSGLVLGGNGRTLATQLVYSGEGGPSAEHLRDLVSARKARLSPAEYLRQGGLFGLTPQATDPLGELLLLALGKWSASPAKLTRAARRYYELAKTPADGQGALFASEALSPVVALDSALTSEGLRA